MCGIAGAAGAIDLGPSGVRRMTEAVRHRGPDDDGAFVDPGLAVLAFRRLSIIDVVHGAQPLFNESKSVAVTCNGEIYNYRELRDGLRRRGHTFRTDSDAEVLPHLYEELGVELLHELQGMFAIALWDTEQRRLLLAIDRLGVKPLYWAVAGSGLVYGSEPGAVLASGSVPARPDPGAIMQYLTLQYVPAPMTGFAGISKLGPGGRLVWHEGVASVDTWWELPEDERTDRPTDEDVLDELDALLAEATRSRLIADVPLGAFLSGGVDSSLVVAYMAEASSVVDTFSIDVPMTGYSEAGHARSVAERFGTSHHEFVVEAEMVPVVADAAKAVGEPFADSSAIPTYLISQATRRNVTVALSGDGGDEAFGGYWRYLRALQLDRLRFLSPLARAIDGHLPSSLGERVPRAERAIRRIGHSPHDRYADLMTHFTPPELETLCTEEFKGAAGGTHAAWDALRLPDYDGINRYCRLDAKTYLPGDVLLKVDRMSMAHALEVRSPFLDYRVQEHAARLPSRFKLRGNKTKWILRELAIRRGVPESAVQRPKMGFSIPVGTWFRGPLRGWITDLLLSPEARGRGHFAPSAVERLIEAHMRSNDNHGSQLWNLAMLELWHRTWIDVTPRRQPT